MRMGIAREELPGQTKPSLKTRVAAHRLRLAGFEPATCGLDVLPACSQVFALVADCYES